MADEYDGRVVIDTELDNSGFEKGSEKLKQSVSGLARALEQLSGTASKTFAEDWKDIDPAAIKPEIDTEEFDEDVAHVKAGLKDIQDTAAGDLPEPEPVQPTIDSAEFDKATDKMQARLNRVTNEVYRIVSASSQGFRNTAGVLAFDNQLSKATDTIEDAKAALKEFAEQQIPTDEYAETTAAIEKTEGQLQKLYDKASQMQHLGVDETSKSWTNLMDQIEQTDNRLRMYEDAAKEMEETGAAFVDPKATEQYEEMREQIQQAEAALQTNVGLIRQEQIEQARMNVLTAQEKVATAGNVLTRKLALAELQRAQNQLAAIAQKSVTPAPDPNKASAWQRFGAVVSKAGGTVLKVGRGIGSVVGTIGNVTKRITGGLKGLFTRARGASGVDGLLKKLTSIKGMLISRIKRTFISELFNDISEAFKELAKFDSRFDRSISNMKNRTKELGANVMGALGGLIRQIEPYITALIDRASEGVKKISAVFAALRGESTMQVAVRQTESYAASLDNAADSAAKAKSAQEKLNRTLTSYDEIHKLDENKTEDAADEASKNGNAVFKTVAVAPVFSGIDESVQDLIRRAKDAIRRGDWRSVGETVAEGFNLAVGKIDSTIHGARDRVLKGAVRIADALNGLTDKFDSHGLGQTIADGLNLGLDTAYAFLTRYDFGKFGLRTAQGFNGLLERFDADGLGRTLAAGFNAVFDFGYQAVSNFQWRKCGTKLGTSVNSFIQNADWSKAAHTFSEGIKGIFDGVIGFIEETDWEQAGEQFAEFFTELDYAGIASKIAEGIGGAIGGTGAFLRGIFRKLAEKGTAWGEHLFDECQDEIEAAGGSIGDAVWIGVKHVFSNSWKKAKEYIFQPFIKGFKKAFGIASPAKEMTPYGEYVGDGILEGVSGVFNNVSDWVRRNILEPFKRGFTAAFDVAGDKAKALIDSGKSIAGGIKDGISNGWTSVTSLISEKADSIKPLFTADKFKALGENVISGISSGLTEDSVIAEKAGKLKTTISRGVDVEGIKQVGRDILDFIGGGLGDEGTQNSTIGAAIRNITYNSGGNHGALRRNVDGEGATQTGRDIAWYIADGLNEAFERSAKDVMRLAIPAAASAFDGWTNSGVYDFYYNKSYNDSALRTVKDIATVASEISDNTDIEISVDSAASMLDGVADKLAQIAQIFQTINRAFTDFMKVPLPAIVTGAYAPAGTRVTDISGSGLTEIKQLLGRFLDRASELEEKIDSRPVRVDVHAEIDKREIARATAEVRQDSNNINNGGGRW